MMCVCLNLVSQNCAEMTDCSDSKICLLSNFRIVIVALHDFGVNKSAAAAVDCNLLFIHYRAHGQMHIVQCPNTWAWIHTISALRWCNYRWANWIWCRCNYFTIKTMTVGPSGRVQLCRSQKCCAFRSSQHKINGVFDVLLHNVECAIVRSCRLCGDLLHFLRHFCFHSGVMCGDGGWRWKWYERKWMCVVCDVWAVGARACVCVFGFEYKCISVFANLWLSIGGRTKCSP